MKTKHLIYTITFLIALGTVVFWVMRPEAQTAEDPWEAWVDEQTDTVLKSAGEMDAAHRAELRASIRAKFVTLAAALKNEIAAPPQTQDYAILQKVKELRKTYDAGYNSKHADTTVRVSYTVEDAEIFAYDENIPLAEVDAKYPRDAWLQMLLDKGITIENANAYWEYMFLRDTLVHLERRPHVWTSGLFGIPATADWETYKVAYIARELGRIQKRLKEEKDRHAWLELPKDFPDAFRENKTYIFRSHGAPSLIEQLTVPQTVKALRDAYDEKYNERYAITSGSYSITLDDGTVFAYKFPLPMSEVDAKYPRDEWLQMLLDKGITVDNFEEYWTYLSQRDTLVELEKQPEIWSSELFGIPPTDAWETYRAAYLKQMLEKLDRDKREVGVYFDKVDAEEALKRVEEHLKELGVLQRPPRPPFNR